VAVLTVVALFAVVVAVDAAAGDGPDTGDEHATLTKSGLHRRAGVERDGNAGRGLFVTAAITLAVARRSAPRRARDLIGPRRRRVGDVGDDWRALLLGAPPAA
jgi:hypothetical protein